MKIGIIEVCEPNHYTAVLALATTYLIKEEHEVYIFTTPAIKPLFAELGNRVKIKTPAENESLAHFLASNAQYQLDRIHINTISKDYKAFAHTQWQAPVYFTVHNTDLWFDNPLIKRFKTLLGDYYHIFCKPGSSNIKLPLILFIKDFIRQHYRHQFIKNIDKKGCKYIVYSHSQEKHLQCYTGPDKTLVFPFCLHTPSADLSGSSSKLRICIPGSVSVQRRDYESLLSMMAQKLGDFKQAFTLDLLGYIPDDGRFLIKQINALQKQGFDIIYNEGFIDSAEFDERLSQCDIILGNLKVQVNAYRKYGETKETGVIFNMIKAAKPGIMPLDYPVDEELKDICFYFNDYEHLASLMMEFMQDRFLLEKVKLKAKKAVKHYEPENLYHLLEA